MHLSSVTMLPPIFEPEVTRRKAPASTVTLPLTFTPSNVQLPLGTTRLPLIVTLLRDPMQDASWARAVGTVASKMSNGRGPRSRNVSCPFSPSMLLQAQIVVARMLRTHGRPNIGIGLANARNYPVVHRTAPGAARASMNQSRCAYTGRFKHETTVRPGRQETCLLLRWHQ